MINVRKLAAVDMALHGARVMVAEFALGIALPLVLGLFSIRAGLFAGAPSWWETALGLWLVGIAANYVPLLIYAVAIARGRTVKQEGQSELAQVKRYGIQQMIILIPFLVVVLALVQESHHHQKAE
jgi:hypothetical protein